MEYPTVKTYALETLLATLMITVGFSLLWPGSTLEAAPYVVIRSWFPEDLGGALLMILGALRMTAILRSGDRYAPLYRATLCAMGGGFWMSMAVSVVAGVVESTGPPRLSMTLPLFSTIFVFEVFAALRTGRDASQQDSLHLKEAGFYGGKKQHGR